MKMPTEIRGVVEQFSQVSYHLILLALCILLNSLAGSDDFVQESATIAEAVSWLSKDQKPIVTGA